jgi:hypothetical protein
MSELSAALAAGEAEGGEMNEKLVKAELTYEREDGSRYSKSVEGEQAQRWKEMTDGVCFMAHVHGANPPWEDIQWTIVESER